MNEIDDRVPRHASWLELFFDLVAVAAVAQLAHLLREEISWADLGIFVIAYYAIWSVWTSFTLYGNVSGDRARVRFMIWGMLCLGVMATAVPGITGERADLFAAMFFASRIAAGRLWERTGEVVTVWPAAQVGLGVAPWFASFWVDGHWKYVLWGIGVLLDIGLSMLQGRRPQKLVDRMAAQYRNRQQWRGRRDRSAVAPHVANVDNKHLGERIGLFMIIVLGEAIVQVVDVTAEEEWQYRLWIAAGAGFGIAVCLWLLTFTYGVLAVPHVAQRHLPTWLALPSHFVMTAAVTAIAAGAGAAMMEPAHHAPAATRWLLCGGAAVFFGAALVAGIILRAERSWLLGAALPSMLVPIALGVFAGPLPGYLLVVGAFIATVWSVVWGRLRVPAHTLAA